MSATIAMNFSPSGGGFPHTWDEVVHTSLPGVKFLANRLANRLPSHIDVEDLVQVGLVGLLQSADRYDPLRGVKFQTYANRRVEGAMLDYLRSLDWRPRSVRCKKRRIANAVAAVEQRLGESATQEDVAAEIGLSAQELQAWMQEAPAPEGWTGGLLHEEKPAQDIPDPLASLADSADSPETAVEKKELRRVIAEAIQRLPRRERLVLSLYYYQQRTMQEIGVALGVKQGRVSQLHSQALRRLRDRMRSPGNRLRPPPFRLGSTPQEPLRPRLLGVPGLWNRSNGRSGVWPG